MEQGTAGLVTRTAILGLLASGGATHGYDLRQQMASMNMDRWASIRLASIYAALKQLAKEGLVEVGERSRQGNRPTRTAYGITSAGYGQLLDLLRESWLRGGPSGRPVDLALLFNAFLPAEEIAALLAERTASFRATVQQIADLRAKSDIPVPGVAAAIDDLFDHSLRVLALEIEFSEHIQQRLRQGAYSLTTEQPGKDKS